MNLKINGSVPQNIYLGDDIYDYENYVRKVVVNGVCVWTRQLILQDIVPNNASAIFVVIYGDDGAFDNINAGDLVDLNEEDEIYTGLFVDDKHYYMAIDEEKYANRTHSIFTTSKNAYNQVTSLNYQEPLLQTYVEQTSGYSHCVPAPGYLGVTINQYPQMSSPSISGSYTVYTVTGTQKCYNINIYNPNYSITATCVVKLYTRCTEGSWTLYTTKTISIGSYKTYNIAGYTTGNTYLQMKVVAYFSDPEGCYYDSNESTLIIGSLDETVDSSTTA